MGFFILYHYVNRNDKGGTIMNEQNQITTTDREPMQLLIEAVYLLAMLPAAILFFLAA